MKKLKKDRANIDTVVKENERLKSMMAEISANAIRRVTESTQANTELEEEMKNVLRIMQKNA